MAIQGNFDLKKLASLPSFYFPTLSHDEKKLAFYYDKTGKMELFVLDLESKELKQVSNGEFPRLLRSDFIWARNNVDILFTKDVDGNEQNDSYKFNTESGELSEISITPNAQEYLIDTSSDGEWIGYMSNIHGQMNVFKMKIDGSEKTQLTATDNPSYGGAFSPDMKYIAFMTNEEGDLKNQDIYLLNNETSDVERVVQEKIGSQDSFGKWSKDSKSFFFSTDVKGSTMAGIYNMETKEITYYGDNLESDIIPLKLTSDGKKIICVINKDSSISPIIFDVATKEMKALNFPPGFSAGGDLVGDRYLILTVNMPTSPSSLVMYDLETDTSEVLLASDTGDIDSSLFINGEHIWYESTDGTMIPAILYKPRDFDPSKKYPALVNPHGGPTGQYFMNFNMFAQFMTDLGYISIFPNVRGSTGYGVDFRDACIMDWGGKDHEDWKAAHSYLIEHVSADPQRIGIFGGSYGGYATLWSMTNSPDLWKAGIAWVPVSNLHNLYKDSMEHFKYYFRQQMGDPEKNKELWTERSPLTHAENMKAPLLLVHGKNDPRCPVTESTNFADELNKHGFKEGEDYEMTIFEDEGHGGLSDITFRIRTFELLVDFLDRKL